VTSSLAVFGAAIRVKSTHLIKSCWKARKKDTFCRTCTGWPNKK